MGVKNPSVGLTKWVESETLYSGKYYTRFTPASTQTNVDAVVTPKGTGGFSLQQADGTNTGGDARGNRSVDLTLGRSLATQVASGTYSFAQGYSCTASGAYSFAYGFYSVASGAYSSAQGDNSTASGAYSSAQGGRCIASGISASAKGDDCTASGNYSLAQGRQCITAILGENSWASGRFSITGDAQRSELILRANTTSATPVNLTANGSAISTLNQLILQNNQSVTAQVLIVAKKSGTTASTAHFRLTVCASRGTSAATNTLAIKSGTANTGGGAGGNGGFQGNPVGNGGSGIVIIAYPDSFAALTSISGGLTYTQPTRSGYRVYQFTGGTGTVTI